ncbi:hypothetical protein ThidrDRAFT_0362 [Thiorhodococcus drewsii AZ1]|uniref:Uncharacterized protein n=1 Tax=Thiorhodococcus drewsii AZ1 TaxID=765913 RepID=G2DWH3_9GAMM|nr:hypothetical protein [Thiorhodococcus drewsii]EGV33673.1 hypothetical protein ThidrDRAFT_0362 [Thiorhodococcus drewsii AZ1]
METPRNSCQIASLDERRLRRLEEAISVTRTKLDVVGIRIEWLGRKLLSTELERADLRRALAERTWEFNLLHHRLRHEQQASDDQIEQDLAPIEHDSSEAGLS